MATRFRIRPLPEGEDKNWIRISKTGRIRIGYKLGDSIRINSEKAALRFTVHQGLSADANKLVVRITSSAMRKLGFKEEDTIEIEKKTRGVSEICMIAIDCSISMGDNGKIDKVKTALGSFFEEKKKIKEDKDRVGLIGFANEAWAISKPATTYEIKAGKIGQSELKWGTNLVKPLQLCRQLIAGGKGKSVTKDDIKDFRKHVIIIADGNSEEDPSQEAQKCKQAGIIIDAIGLIDLANRDHQLRNLQTITRLTGGTYVPIDQADLATLVKRLSCAAKDKTLTR